MKTKEARKIAKSAANGTMYPVHVLRKAALQLGRPIVIKGYGDFTFFPKGLKGKFVRVAQYRPVYVRDIILPVGTDLTAYQGRNGYVRDITLTAGQHELDFSAGCSVDYGCVYACRLARQVGVRVPFDWNGDTFTATPNTDAAALYAFWQSECERKRQEYYASDEYKQFLAEQEAERVREQAIIDGLVSTLDEAVKDRETLLTWLSEFAAHADNSNISYPKISIGEKIKDAGYRSNAWVGCKDWIMANKEAEAEYIIGQALACIDKGMPPHPVLTNFVARYRGEEAYPEDHVEEESEETVGV